MTWNMDLSQHEYAILMEAGFMYRYARRFQEAREIFESVRALQPLNEMAEIALGGVSFDEDNFDDAVAHCLKAISLNPNSARAYAQLGEVQLFKSATDLARLNLQKAVQLDSVGRRGTVALQRKREGDPRWDTGLDSGGHTSRVARALLKLADTF